MRSNMKWLYVLSFLMAVTLAATAATTSPSILNDSEEPGSVLVFPLYRAGTVVSPDNATLLPQSEFEISVVCPNGSVCPDGTDIDIRLHWVCDDFAPQCQERDFNLATTVNGTLRFDPQGNCSPANSSNNFFETCGAIPPPPCEDGYLIAWVVDETGAAIKYDALIGDAVLRDSSTQVTAYNAIPIQAGAKLATGAATDIYHNGHLNFNGVAYKELSNTIIGSLHYDGVDPVSGVASETELVLLTLDTKSNLPNNPVEVNFQFYNEIEQLNSNNAAFFCTEEVFLETLGEFNTFGIKGLVEGEAAKTPILGVFDKTGPVTLLGLVITHEDGFSREYAYELYNNSMGLATAFAP
jgi:hypothetical protein